VTIVTEPGGPITTSTPITTPTPTTTTPTPTTTTTTTSGVPAPANATTMKCDEFTQLGKPQRLAVVKQILQNNKSVFGPLGDDFAESMASTMCQFMTEETVYEVLTGSPPS
jgi:hypothetical protein